MCSQLMPLLLVQVLDHTKGLAVWGFLLYLSKGVGTG
jgi:hypothetical protein